VLVCACIRKFSYDCHRENAGKDMADEGGEMLQDTITNVTGTIYCPGGEY